MVIARRIAYNILFNMFVKTISTALALVGIGFITRYLGKEGFGNYATAIAFSSFFMAVADLGMYAVATREISRPGADEKKVLIAGESMAMNLITWMLWSAYSSLAVAKRRPS